MRTTTHAKDQAEKRGVDVRIIEGRVAFEAARIDGDTAVLVGTLPAERHVTDGSNGDQVWAIVRGGVIVTVMFRRSNQPATPERLRVETVLV